MAPSQTFLFSGQLPGCPCYSGGTVPDSHRLLYECFRNLYLVRLYAYPSKNASLFSTKAGESHKFTPGKAQWPPHGDIAFGYLACAGKTHGLRHMQGKKACCKGGQAKTFSTAFGWETVLTLPFCSRRFHICWDLTPDGYPAECHRPASEASACLPARRTAACRS